MRDAAGRSHTPCAEPRIVSLVPSLTELLFALQLGDRIVGRTSFCVHPAPEVDEIPRIGGTKTPRLDKISALAPTHVLVNIDENRREDVEALAAAGVEPVVTHPLSVDDNLALYELLGWVFERVELAEQLAGEFRAARQRLAEQRAQSEPPRRALLDLVRPLDERVARYLYRLDAITAELAQCLPRPASPLSADDQRRNNRCETGSDHAQQRAVSIQA